MESEVVWAVHRFVAENDDELSFDINERIETDEEFNDGWWQGRNVKGEVGLFPRDYTSSTKAPVANGAPNAHSGPVLAATMSDIQNAIDQIQPEQQPGLHGRHLGDEVGSLHDADDLATPTDHSQGAGRALLAAKARDQLDREAAQRQQDLAPPIADLQLSDDSDDESLSGILGAVPRSSLPRVPDDSTAERLSLRHPTPKPSLSSYEEVDEEGDGEEPSQDVGQTGLRPASSSGSASGTPAATPSLGSSASMVAPAMGVRSDSQATRTAYTDQSGRRSTSPSTVSFTPSAYARSSFDGGSVREGTLPESRFSATTFASRPTDADSLRQQSSRSSINASSIGPTAAAGMAGAALATAAAAVHSSLSARRSEGDAEGFVVDGRERPSTENRHNDPQAATSAQPLTPHSTASSFSRAQSQTGASTAATSANLSPRSSLEMRTKVLGPDPTTWDVADVLEWGRQKGFDQTTLSKFQEHEISGDILLELDINTLKEIDLPAFGRRVHIYNAIKELKQRVDGVSPSPAQLSALSSTLTSPIVEEQVSQTRSVAPVLSPALPTAGPLMETNRSIANEPAPARQATAPAIQGLGFGRFDGEVPQVRAQQVSEGRPSPEASAQDAARTATPTALPSYSTQTRHGRSGTAGTTDSFHSVNEAADDAVAGAADTAGEPRADDQAKVTRSGTRSSTHSRSSQAGESPNTPASPDNARFGSLRSPKMPFASNLRTRKAPPRASFGGSSGDADKEGRGSRRSTRLFGFGSPQPAQTGTFGSDARPVISGPMESGTGGLNGSSSSATAAPTASPSTGASKDVLEQIGTPDLAGWLRKKGDRMAQWKTRYVILKGRHLYAVKSQQEKRVKGWVDLAGYKVLPDNDGFGGNYGFKLIHSSKPSHYFSSEDPLAVRRWMKALMKSSITRDYSAPVLSSNNIATIPLAEAQAMFPPPRPPSPTSRARAQQLRMANTNPNTLTPKDAEILMSLQKPGVPIAPPRSGKRASRAPSTLTRGSQGDAVSPGASPISPISPGRSSTPPPTLPPTAVVSSPSTPEFPQARAGGEGADAPLLRWANDHLPPGMPEARDFSSSFKSGQRILRLAEELSGRSKGIPDSRFASLRPGSDEELDAGFDIYDFLLDLGVDTGDVSVGELLRGERAPTVKLVKALEQKYGN